MKLMLKVLNENSCRYKYMYIILGIITDLVP